LGGGGSSWPADVEAGSFAPGGIDFDVDAVAGEDLADGPEAQAVALNALVVTLNSKILGRTSGEMPVPSPVTVSHEIPPPRGDPEPATPDPWSMQSFFDLMDIRAEG
jgi:hypothetical protein